MKTRSQKLTDKSKLVLNIILMGSLLITLSSVVRAATNDSAVSINEQTSSTLSIDEAKEIAAFSVVELSGAVSNLSEWKDASVEHDITFYDLGENITAYAFNVVKNNEYDGFIIISATKDKYPVLEFSKGKLPNKIPTIAKKSQSTVLDYATKNQLKIGKNIPIYEGATFYYTKYNLIDSKNEIKKKIIVDDVTSNLTSLETKTTLLGTNKVEAVESNEIKKAWNSLENEMALKCEKAGTGLITSTPIVLILTVPYETWYRGCAPTSASMVLEYWDDHGYSNFPRGGTLIDELANAMGTTSGGSTSNGMIDNGIETVCNNHGYTNFDAVTDSSMSMSEVMTEINAARPFTVSMTNGGAPNGDTEPYGNHTVTCIGYSDGTTTDTLYIHDTWDGFRTHGITFGNWGSVVATWVRP